MRAPLLLLFLALSAPCFGQGTATARTVAAFKNEFLKEADPYRTDTLHTAEALYTRERLSYVRRICTFPKAQRIRYDEYYYNDTRVLESNTAYKLPGGELTGISRQYTKKGQLEYVQDHDKGTWTVVRFEHYPYYPTLVRMKGVADSIVRSAYGDRFFEEHLVWFPEACAFYDGKGAGATWYDYEEWPPKEFLLRYSIRLSDTELYDEQIEISLDSTGAICFPFGKYDAVKGLEKTGVKNGFALSRQTAIEQARRLGLAENDSAKAFTFLDWHHDSRDSGVVFNGHFTYNVAIRTKTILYPPAEGRNRIESKFDVYRFNPWTGGFVEKQRMKSFREWEPHSGLTTGMYPD